VIYVGPRDDYGYNQAQADGQPAALKKDGRHQGRRGREPCPNPSPVQKTNAA
jgi:basic membrane lipoprotein Med (substrate-binding protein (PBP1-ABC) superfamily)